MDVASWLRSLGLEQYEAAFRDNAIDDSVLPDLTDQDLEKLGVLLGHRRKLLRATANLQGTQKTAAGALGIRAAGDALPRDTAERRQVTVMFSDLVGSTTLSARMDLRTYARSSPPIRSASPIQCNASAASLRNTWVTAYSSISVTRTPTRMTPRGR